MSSLSQSFFSFIVRVAFVFEPLAPPLISYYLGRRLKEWQEKGRVSEFETKTERLGKFHYKIEVDLNMTEEQAYRVLDDLLPDTKKRREVN